MKKLMLLLSIVFFLENANAQLKIYSNNYAGINLGTSDTPLAPLHVKGNVYIPAGYSYWINSTNDQGVRLRLHANTSAEYIDFYPLLNFRTGTATYLSTSPLILTPTGVGVNNTTPTCALDVTGTAKVNGAVVLTSDQRLKENIHDMSGSLAKTCNRFRCCCRHHRNITDFGCHRFIPV